MGLAPILMACMIGDPNYPDTLTVDEASLAMRVTGHRTSMQGISVFQSSPFETSYTLNYGDGWIRLKIPNGNKGYKTVCHSAKACEICR